MKQFFTSTSLISTIALLSACGGGGGGSDPIEPFSLPSQDGVATAIQLDATALTTAESTGDWDSSNQTFTISGQTLAAVGDSDVTDGLTFVSQIAGGDAGETLVYTPTLADGLPSGTATYEGMASVVISDGATTSVSYDLIGSSLAVANISDGDLDLTISGLSGNRTASAAGPQAFSSNGPISIDNLTLSSSGSIGADGDTATTITGIDSVAMDANAAADVSGGIAGTTGQEIAGVAAISDADTILLTTFAGQQ